MVKRQFFLSQPKLFPRTSCIVVYHTSTLTTKLLKPKVYLQWGHLDLPNSPIGQRCESAKMPKPKQKWEVAKTKAQIEYMYVKAKVRKAKEWSYYCMKSTLHSRLCNFTLSPSPFFLLHSASLSKLHTIWCRQRISPRFGN